MSGLLNYVKSSPKEVAIRRSLGLGPHVARLLGSFWATSASAFKWYLLTVALLPAQVESMVGGRYKEAYWGIVFALGISGALIGHSIFSRFNSRQKNRAAGAVGGSLLTLVALALLFESHTIGALGGALLLLGIADDLTLSPFVASIPVSSAGVGGKGFAGVLSIAAFVGLAGSIALSLLDLTAQSLYLAVALCTFVGGGIALFSLSPRLLRHNQDTAHYEGPVHPTKSRGGVQFHAASFFATLSLYSLVPYLYYLVGDIFRQRNEPDGSPSHRMAVAAIFILAVAVGYASALPFVLGGRDSRSRRITRYTGAVAVLLALCGMALFPPLPGFYWLAFLLGIGYCSLRPPGWDMGDESAKGPSAERLESFKVAALLGQITVGLLGLLIMEGNKVAPTFGYELLFMIAALSALYSAWMQSATTKS